MTADIKLLEREITKAELDIMDQDFLNLGMKYNAHEGDPKRFSFVAELDGKAIGLVSGLTYYSWCFLSDLWLEEPYRKMGLGARLLSMFEERIAGAGTKKIYTWTAGYEAPGFYKKQGYVVFHELEDYYPSGYSRVGLRKNLK
ncbi:MAG: GNAT family N-acetyltransferase [Alphaproteobacteria bacterium]|nr:GNAT family N-acetyltransferase [Alphaproteobacteria bacterium]